MLALGLALNSLEELRYLKIEQIPIGSSALCILSSCIPKNLEGLSLWLGSKWMNDSGLESLKDQINKL